MHQNPAYRTVGAARNLAFARERSFGVAMISGAEGPLASHIPFLIDEPGERLTAHILRSNPIWRALREGPMRACIAISGPDGYISPDWYGNPANVPTWNYIAVHLRGEMTLADETGLRDHLDALSAHFEARLAPKTPWTTAKMEPDALSRMMRMIAPVTMRIESIDGTWKLGQNKSEEARLGAAEGLESSAIGMELPALAELMRSPPG